MEGKRDVCYCLTTLSSTHPVSHHNPTPRRRNEHMPWLRHRPIQTTHLFFLIFLTCCLSFSSATVYIEEQMIEAQDDGLGSGSASGLAGLGPLLADPAWTPERLQALHETAGDLRRRDEHASKDSSSSTSTVSGTATTTVALSSTLIAATPLATSQLPVPFDIGFSNNITSSCSSFMTSMLTNSTFKSCLPFSLLLQVCPPIGPSSPTTLSDISLNRTPIPSSKPRNQSPA
jgi:hypothetical protein